MSILDFRKIINLSLSQRYENKFLEILTIFLLTRIAIFGITLFVQQVLPFNLEAEQITGVVNIFDINLESALNQLGKGDVGWYQSIIDSGYERIPYEETKQHNWAFFPLWPLVWWLGNQIIPNRIFSGIVLVNLFFLLSLLNIYELSLKLGISRRNSMNSVLLLCIHPMNYFFSFPFTESLFLFLSTSFCLNCVGDRWILAGFWGLLASLTRPNGIFLIIIPLYSWIADLVKSRKIDKSKILTYLSCCLLIFLGLAIFMLYLQQITGNLFAFSDIQIAWSKKNTFFVSTIIKYLQEISLLVTYWDFRISNLISLCIGSGLIAFFWKQSYYLSSKYFLQSLSIYSLLGLLMPASSGILSSLTRYTLVYFPLFISLSIFLDIYPRFFNMTLISFSLLLGAMLVLYSSGYVLAAS